MKKLQNFFNEYHAKASRDYSSRAGSSKPLLAEKAKNFDVEYWDGSRNTGYGGYVNDGRWIRMVDKISAAYPDLKDSSILDIGSGKGFFLEELKKRFPESTVSGIEISAYAVAQSHPDIKKNTLNLPVEKFSFEKNKYDYIFSFNTLHNLKLPDLFSVLKGIEESKRKESYICVESYRNEFEKWNLMQWQLTCECFFNPEEWLWIFDKTNYTGDYEFIYFE